MKVTILRGLPGSGKSTWIASNVSANAHVFSADAYHMVLDGGRPVYKFDPANARKAHDWCLSQFLLYLTRGAEHLVVDNTNLSAWEISPYYRLAEVYGCEVEIVYLRCSPSLSLARNIHGVPEATILQMFARLMSDTLPPWWNMRVIEANGTEGGSDGV